MIVQGLTPKHARQKYVKRPGRIYINVDAIGHLADEDDEMIFGSTTGCPGPYP